MDATAIESTVSRETLADLRHYESLLKKWTKTINLVSKRSVEEAWERHVLDGLQLWELLGDARALVDLGSGGGIPALPLAIAAKHSGQLETITMIESDRRKSTFLFTVVRDLGLSASVVAARSEEAPAQNADICTARALASCSLLFEYAHRHLRPGGKCLFLKGENAETEILEARQSWHFSLVRHQSKTDPKATILEIGDLRRV